MISVRKKFDQFVLATHSIEIINEAEANELISIDSEQKSGRRVNSELEFSALYQYIGSGSNADFARIVRAKKVIFVEGKDAKILRKMGNRFRLNGLAQSQDVPIIQLGGFSEWKKAAHAVWAFKDILNVEVRTFCLFDRDYKCSAEVDQFLCEIRRENLRCRIFDRKEIENYVFDPTIISRAVSNKQKKDGRIVLDNAEIVDEMFDEITDEMKLEVGAQLIANALRWAKKSGSKEDESTIIQRITKEIDRMWRTRDGRMKLVSGKTGLSELNQALLAKRMPTVTLAALIDQMDIEEEFDDLREVLRELDQFCLQD